MKYKIGDILQSNSMINNNVEAIITDIKNDNYIFDDGGMVHAIVIIDGSSHIQKYGNMFIRTLANL